MSSRSVKVGKAVVVVGVVLSCCLGASKPANATLGGDVASVAGNAQRMGGQRHVQKLASGERHDLQLPSGMLVHEFVSPAGAVYAITWSGPRAPDLRELMGVYLHTLFRPEASARVGRLHRMTYSGTDLVIQASGHRGVFEGRAWVPSLVPAGLDIGTALEVSR